MVAKLANNASSTLAGSINTSVTSVSIASGDASKFPTLAAGQWFPLTVVDNAGNMEIMKVTARSGATLTVERGQEGTTAKAFATGSKCDLRLTAAAAAATALAIDATAVTQEFGDNTAAVANTEFVQSAISPISTSIEDVETALQDLEEAVPLALEERVRFDAAQSKTAAQQGQARANVGASVLAGFRDKLINGNGAINQRLLATVADDTYWCDRHYALTQTATVTPSILSDVANGLPSMMRLLQAQATAQRMGNAQILEAAVSKPLRGDTVTLGGRARCSSAQNLRYAILEWTGAADAVTSDVVNNWTSTNYTAGNFFLATNLVVAAVGSIALPANTVTNWSLTAPISGACNNIITLYWTEAAVAQNVTLDMAWGLVEADASAEVYPYETRHPQQELALCQRYFEKSYDLAVSPGTAISAGALTNVANAGGVVVIPCRFAVRKRVIPAMAYFSPYNGTSGVLSSGTSNFTAATQTVASLGSTSTLSEHGVNVQASGLSSGFIGAAHFTADAEL